MPALTTVVTHATGDVFPATDWNIDVRDNINYLIVAGATLASAASVVTTNEFHQISGATQIDNISPATPVAGQQVRLLFQGGLTIRNNGGGTGNIRTLSGNSRPVSANDIVTFVYDGAVWREQAASGTVPEAATLAALNALFVGTPPDGARGSIRAASGAIVQLVYDSQFGHWVSNPFPLGGVAVAAGIGATSATPAGSFAGVDWDFVQVAGLTMQAKWSGVGVTSNGASAMHGGIYILFGNFTTGFTSATLSDSTTVSTTGGAVGVDWASVSNPGAYEVAAVGLYQYNASGGNIASVQGAVVGRFIG